MPEIGPEHSLSYRSKIADSIFASIHAGESCSIAGAASMGKSRLLHFILRADVQAHYLDKSAKHTLLVWVDCNRMAAINEWGLYELILTGLAEAVDEASRGPLLDLRHQAIVEHNALLAQRNVEMALRMLCYEEGLKVVLILDEFDECYRSLPGQALANLRALRDMNKYLLSYVLFMREDPFFLRHVDDSEGFYELISRSVLGLTPYNKDDSIRVIDQILARREHEVGDVPDDFHEQIIGLSAGHPGLIVALVDEFVENPPMGNSWMEWAQRTAKAQEECRKIWNGLRREEQMTLRHIAMNASTGYLERGPLELKGLIKQAGEKEFALFSPMLQRYIGTQAAVSSQPIIVDSQTGDVWLNGQPVVELTAQEFKLIELMYNRQNEICSVDEIIEGIYDENEGFGISNNAVSALIKRVRAKLEPDPKHPRYLLNVKGRGYKLVVESEGVDVPECSQDQTT